ncbi:transcription initiation factor TFIID subunit 3 isoform X2 [Contarinia nasturtii]|uniref:transcription initiation factor TFIID subunit 3 isoform X2 n=1 Tax=Contarinia nasturtii TaxID=265458 RepID=UPI0012D4993B|nr:transcription initiation factor TFIID subunit 3 isoform X2 [Contarinia nasturtii]
MSLPYIQQLTKVIVAQITQTIGWNSIQTTPLELITDILHKYLEELTRQTQRYTELYGRTEPNLDDIALAFNDLNINIADLEEYITNVDSVPCIVNVPKFPIAKESNLNFLKPGSKEVVTRPVHIHEHLPPIQPHEETPPAEEAPKLDAIIQDEHNSTNIIQTYISTNQISDRPVLMDENGIFEHDGTIEGSEAINVIGETTVIENHTTVSNDENTFRKPFDVIPSTQTAAHRPPPSTSINNNENGSNAGRKTREIVSCFMTTGGFISPAREGKLPEARKPIVIPEEPEPEEIEIKQRTPSPEIIESKHHDLGKDAHNTSHTDGSYEDGENTKGVKLYEVIQTMPDALQKKKTKKSQIDVTQIKEQKKQKKINQLKANRNNDHPFSHIIPKGDGSMPMNNSDPSPVYEKMKKKFARLDTLKKKYKQKQLNGNLPFSVNDTPELQEKPRKKKMSKLSKKNLQAIGLNPNVMEGFTIPSVTLDPYSMHETATNAYPPKESLKKIKQFQKLSTEPDKQKIKFFKKLSSTASNLLSKPNDDPHEYDRMLNPIVHPMLSNHPNDLNHQMVGQELFENDRFGSGGKFDHICGMTDMNRMPPNLDNLPPSKKLKLLKKLNKPPKEPKITKTKKYKKDPLAKKERVPKTPKLLDPPYVMTPIPPPVSSYNVEENPLSKMFLNDDFRPNVGLINQYPMPGLNFNPLFQSVRFDLPVRDQIQNNPFGPGLQNFDFANLNRFKRPNFNDPTHQKDAENLSKHSQDTSKPLCNVAPLMPPSFDIEMHHKNEYIANSSLNESLHSSQKHYQEPSNANFGSKKSVMFSNANPHVHEVYNSPIVISGDDDDDDEDDDDNDDNNKHRNPSHSPSHPSISGFEVKRKKVKDKKDKEKKEKKDKDTGAVKLKKKKDKKDKSKNKGEHSKSPKDKSALKKEKREKKKERERSAALVNDANDSIVTTSNIFYGSTQAHTEWQHDAFSKDPDHSHIGNNSLDMNQTFNTENSNLETSTIPKLTLKLAPSSSSPSSRTSRPSTPDFPVSKKSSKKKKKQWRTMDEDSEKSDVEVVGICGKLDEQTSEQIAREPSPELARISALITRPPKQKSSNKQQTTDFNSTIKNEYFDASVPARSDYNSSMASSTVLPPTPSGRGRPKGSSSLKSSKSKSSKASASFASDPDKKSQTFDNQSNIIDPHNVPNVIQADEQTNDENQVWICPACGRVDDGTPMIGCDGCDDWYHWVCVGILVPPNEDQDWFCRVCISRKQEDKKKKRKKKDKKDH